LGAGAAGFAAVFALHVLTMLLVGVYRAPRVGGVWFCGFLFAAVLVVLADRRLKT
jgi:quinol-cytochrome oxidoreductase complex cytochrome b subunit